MRQDRKCLLFPIFYFEGGRAFETIRATHRDPLRTADQASRPKTISLRLSLSYGLSDPSLYASVGPYTLVGGFHLRSKQGELYLSTTMEKKSDTGTYQEQTRPGTTSQGLGSRLVILLTLEYSKPLFHRVFKRSLNEPKNCLNQSFTSIVKLLPWTVTRPAPRRYRTI